VATKDPQGHAPAVVPDAAKGHHGAVAAVIKMPAGDQPPLDGIRPHEANVMLVGLVVAGDVIGITRSAETRVRGPGTGGTVEAHGLVAVQVTDIENLARIVGRLVMP